MRASSPGAFALSAAFHAVVIGAFVAVSLWVQKATQINPQIFDLVNPDDIEIGAHFEMPGAPSKNPGVKENAVRFKKSKVKAVKIPTAAEIAAAEAKAAAEVAKATKSAPTTTTASTRNKTSSYAEFQQKNAKQLAANQKVQGAAGAKGKAAPGIDSKSIVDDLMEAAAGPRGDGGGTGGSKVMIAALDAYFNRLISALRAAHEMPDSVDDLLIAKVEFFLATDGSISRVKVVKSSGNREYDDSVIDAFHKVRSIGAVPGAKSGTYQIDFKMTE